MKTIRLNDFGGPEMLRIEDMPRPVPKQGEVLIRVAAASINPVDWKTRAGSYPMVSASDLPRTLGRDVAGTVEEVGPGVEGITTGDEVFAMLEADTGGYAEYAAVKAQLVAAKPANLSLTEAAAVPLAGLTAWQGLFDQGGLEEGQRVLILGGSGGVGHFAVQFAKARGAWVAATASGTENGFLRDLGADQPVAYDQEDVTQVVEPVDVVLDLLGGKAQAAAMTVLKPGGIIVSTLGEPESGRDDVRRKGFLVEPNGRQLDEIAALIDAGRVKVTVQRVLPLDQAAEAQRLQENEHSHGKTVLQVK